jgi:hypothetical protein
MSMIEDQTDGTAVEERPELAALLAKISELHAEKEQIAAREKEVNKRLASLESTATELIRAGGFERIGAAGKTWWVEDTLNLSVLKENREKVLEAAAKEGLREELMTVQTSTLKSWLLERAKRLGRPASGSYAEGTAFAGLLSENPVSVLRRRTVA